MHHFLKIGNVEHQAVHSDMHHVDYGCSLSMQFFFIMKNHVFGGIVIMVK